MRTKRETSFRLIKKLPEFIGSYDIPDVGEIIKKKRVYGELGFYIGINNKINPYNSPEYWEQIDEEETPIMISHDNVNLYIGEAAYALYLKDPSLSTTIEVREDINEKFGKTHHVYYDFDTYNNALKKYFPKYSSNEIKEACDNAPKDSVENIINYFLNKFTV